MLIQCLGPKLLIISDKTLRQTEARKSIGHPGHEPVRVAVATFFWNMQFKCLDTGIQYSSAIFELFTNAGGFEGGCVVGVWEGKGNLTQAIRCPSTCTSKHEADLLEWCQLVNITQQMKSGRQHCFLLNSNAILLIAWVSRCELRSRPGIKRPFPQKNWSQMSIK